MTIGTNGGHISETGRLLKPTAEVGIVGYGAYVPRTASRPRRFRACGRVGTAARRSRRRPSPAWTRTW